MRGLEGSEDAGVYEIAPGTALVQSVDLLTPIVDDPWTFGRIAAVNALSDLYAMGAKPITAMNVLCYPVEALGVESLRQVIIGGLSAVSESGAVLVGGHSIKDEEPKYGLAVSGLVDSDALMTNDGLEVGHQIILTKPIGTGVVSSANKRGKANRKSVEAMVVTMSALNNHAATAARAAGVRAATDITGFGLGGHLIEMARASRRSVRIWAGEIPLLPGAFGHALADSFPGGSRANRSFFAPFTKADAAVDDATVGLIFDAQTSGGLLVGVAPDRASAMLAELEAAEVSAALVGEVLAPHDQGELLIVPERL